MQVLKSACRFRKLQPCLSIWESAGRTEIGRTRQMRLTSGCFDVKSMMFPSTIHSVMIHNENSFGETPNTVRMFGWERRLQIRISWNKCCYEPSDAHMPCEIVGVYLFDLE